MRSVDPNTEFRRWTIKIWVEGYAPWLMGSVNCDSDKAQVPGVWDGIGVCSNIGSGNVLHSQSLAFRETLLGRWTGIASACANLDEVEIIAVASDQVYFTIGTMPVTGNQGQAAHHQGLSCYVFTTLTKTDFRARHAVFNHSRAGQQRKLGTVTGMGAPRKE